MKMKECLQSAAVFLQLKDVAKELIKDDTQGCLEEISELLECANFVFCEIASDYLPIKKSIAVKAENRKIDLSVINEKIIRIYRVLKDGRSEPFKTDFDSVKTTGDGDFVLECSVEPPKYALNDEIVYRHNLISARVAGYGIACEYCLINGMSDEAVLWDKRYKDALEEAVLPKNERKVRARLWL